MTTRSSTATASARRRWRGSNFPSVIARSEATKQSSFLRRNKKAGLLVASLLAMTVRGHRLATYLIFSIRRREIRQRHRDRHGFLCQGLERHFQLFARLHRREQVRRDRRAGKTAALLAGLHGKIDRLAVIDLNFRATRQIEAERQQQHRKRRTGIAGHTDGDEHDQLPGLGQHRRLLDRAFQRHRAVGAGAAADPAGLGRRDWPLHRLALPREPALPQEPAVYFGPRRAGFSPWVVAPGRAPVMARRMMAVRKRRLNVRLRL